MGKEDVTRYIIEKMKEPTEITGDDLSPPVCRWCGEELGMGPDDVVIWEMPVHQDPGQTARQRYCSEECKDQHRKAIINDEDLELHGDVEYLEAELGTYE